MRKAKILSSSDDKNDKSVLSDMSIDDLQSMADKIDKKVMDTPDLDEIELENLMKVRQSIEDELNNRPEI